MTSANSVTSKQPRSGVAAGTRGYRRVGAGALRRELQAASQMSFPVTTAMTLWLTTLTLQMQASQWRSGLQGQPSPSAHALGLSQHAQYSGIIFIETSCLFGHMLCSHPCERLMCSHTLGFQSVKHSPFFSLFCDVYGKWLCDDCVMFL